MALFGLAARHGIGAFVSSSSSGTAYGIDISGATASFAVNNWIAGADVGIDYNSGSTGKYRDNRTFGVASPFTGTGTDAGNDN